MFKRRLIILGILSIFCIAITTGLVSANENVTEVVSLDQNIDDELQVNELNELKETYSDSTLNEENEINSGGDDLLEMYNDDSEVISSENSDDYDITDTEVYLIEPINEKSYYILDTISNYPNTDTKFIIHITPYKNNKEAGTVTLKFNGNSYSAEVFNGKAIINAKTPSKVGIYKCTLSYSGHTYPPSKESYYNSSGYFYSSSKGIIYNPSSSIFTLTVKSSTNSVDTTTTVKAPKMTAHYKAKKYFKVTVKKDGNPVKSLKLKVKVFKGSKSKTYNIKTNKKGIAKFNTNKLSPGKYKVCIWNANSKYGLYKESKITIKKTAKKSNSKYKIITTKAKTYWISKKSGSFKVKTKIWDMTAGYMAPYKYIDTTLYKNGKQVYNTKYSVKYKINGKWTGWSKYGTTSTAHHRHAVSDGSTVDKIKVKVKKNVNSFM